MTLTADYVDYNQQEEHQQASSSWKDRVGRFVQGENDKFQAFTKREKARTRLRKAYKDLKNDIKAEPGKSFSDLLKERTGIDLFETGNLESELYLKIALSDSRFRSVPLLVTSIPVEGRSNISEDPHSRVIMLPDDIKRQYNRAVTVADLVAAIEENAQYASMMPESPFKVTQSDIYGGKIFENDLQRLRCDLKIFDRNTQRTINIIISNNAELCEGRFLIRNQNFIGMPKQIQLNAILNQINQQSAASGLILTNVEAFSILKQFVLAYRGQNAKTELFACEMNAALPMGLNMKTPPSLIDSMYFERTAQGVNLVSKSENTDAGEIIVIQSEEKIADSYNFGFIYPKDAETSNKKEILSTLKIKSTVVRDQAGDIIGWDCPFRENPPTHFILYGGGSSN